MCAAVVCAIYYISIIYSVVWKIKSGQTAIAGKQIVVIRRWRGQRKISKTFSSQSVAYIHARTHIHSYKYNAMTNTIAFRVAVAPVATPHTIVMCSGISAIHIPGTDTQMLTFCRDTNRARNHGLESQDSLDETAQLNECMIVCAVCPARGLNFAGCPLRMHIMLKMLVGIVVVVVMVVIADVDFLLVVGGVKS